MYYGLVKAEHAIDIAIAVCEVLGYGSTGKAVELLLETAAQETKLGVYRDPTAYAAGSGLCQFDRVAFDDVKRRARNKHADAILDEFGVDIRVVEYRELELNPFLSLLFCRLFYLLIVEAIPVTVGGRGEYWKRYYNTAAGKGSAVEYENSAAIVAGLMADSEAVVHA